LRQSPSAGIFGFVIRISGLSMEFLAGLVVFGLLVAFFRSISRQSPRLKETTHWVGQREIDTYELTGRAYVVDGDTLVIAGYNIRLAGIDAPEMDHPYGKNAKWHLVNLTKGQPIRAVFHGEQSYAREVATCYLHDGRDLSAEMVAAGLAIDWPKFSGGKYRHLEPPDARKRMWRADARQKGKWTPTA